MKKKHSGGGGANWMDTYGDMVTLLLCFFVMLYSMSTMDKEKWIALVESFNPDAVTEQNPGGHEVTNDLTQEQVDADIQTLYETMMQYVQQENLAEQVSITKGSGYVFVSFDDAVFFDGDSYTLLDEGKQILDEVAQAIAQVSWDIPPRPVPWSPTIRKWTGSWPPTARRWSPCTCRRKTSLIRRGLSAWGTASGVPLQTIPPPRAVPRTGGWSCRSQDWTCKAESGMTSPSITPCGPEKPADQVWKGAGPPGWKTSPAHRPVPARRSRQWRKYCPKARSTHC